MSVVWHSTTSCHIQLEMNNETWWETFSMMSFPFNEFDWSQQPFSVGNSHVGVFLLCSWWNLWLWFGIVKCFHHLAPHSFPVLVQCFVTQGFVTVEEFPVASVVLPLPGGLWGFTPWQECAYEVLSSWPCDRNWQEGGRVDHLQPQEEVSGSLVSGFW